MDEDDITHLKCDVKLNLTGSTIEDLTTRASQDLRKIAELIGNNDLEYGFYKFVTHIDVVIGNIYIEYRGLRAEIFDACEAGV